MKCAACPNTYHPATGHAFTKDTCLCGTCARDFYQWYKRRMGQMQARIKKKGVRQEESFHDAAMRSVVGD
jgi:hypothetical protein